MEHAAEDIIDFAPTGTWDKIDADVSAINDAWQAYQPRAGGDGAPEAVREALTSALTRLQGATATHDSAATMQAANDLSAAVVELFALYGPPIPADIGRLDVLERQVILDLSAQNFEAAAANLKKTKAVWDSVKPALAERGGTSAAAEFETSLASRKLLWQPAMRRLSLPKRATVWRS